MELKEDAQDYGQKFTIERIIKLKKRGIEILYTLEPIDDFVLSHLGSFDEKKLVSADRVDLRLPDATEKEEQKEQLAEAVQTSLCKWSFNSYLSRI
jgi:HSP90 family molecular chaperone